MGSRFVHSDEIVECARALLADSWTTGDIKRLLVKKFGGTGRSFERYLSVARERNLESLGRTPREAKADSVQQWVRMQAECRVERGKASQAVQAAEVRVSGLQKAFDDANVSDLKLALVRLEMGLRVLDRAEKNYAAANRGIARHQHTLDRILGNLAPLKLEDATKSNQELAYPIEPLTHQEGEDKLQEILDKIRQAVAAEANLEAAPHQ